MRVHGTGAVELVMPLAHPGTDFALLDQAVVLDVRQAHQREGVVDLGEAHVLRRDARSSEEEGRRVSRVRLPETARWPRAADPGHDVDGRVLEITGPFGGSDHHGNGAIAL